MKKLGFLLILFVLFLIILVSCNKDITVDEGLVGQTPLSTMESTNGISETFSSTDLNTIWDSSSLGPSTEISSTPEKVTQSATKSVEPIKTGTTQSTTQKITVQPNTNTPVKTPVVTPKPTIIVTKTPTQEPIPTQDYSWFDINEYVKYAKSYGESIGLIHYELNGDSWNAPLNVYPEVGDEQIKSSIRTACKRLVDRDEAEYFKIAIEKVSTNSYKMYFYYA